MFLILSWWLLMCNPRSWGYPLKRTTLWKRLKRYVSALGSWKISLACSVYNLHDCPLQNATQKSQKVFVHVPSEIAAHEVEEIGKDFFIWYCTSNKINVDFTILNSHTFILSDKTSYTKNDNARVCAVVVCWLVFCATFRSWAHSKIVIWISYFYYSDVIVRVII